MRRRKSTRRSPVALTDRVGQRFGDMVVVGVIRKPCKGSQVVARCSCGREVIVRMPNLLMGRTSRCQECCLRRQKRISQERALSRPGRILVDGCVRRACADCGIRAASTGRCSDCRAIRGGRPIKYPISIGKLAKLVHRTKEAVRQQIVRRGFQGMLLWYGIGAEQAQALIAEAKR